MKLTRLILETTGSSPIELSIEEAKDLYDQLYTLFGKSQNLPIFPQKDNWNFTPNNPYWYHNKARLTSDTGVKLVYCGVQEG